MAIRSFQESDFPAVCRVYLDAKRDELSSEPDSLVVLPLEEDAPTLEAFRESEVIVHDSGEVLGFAATFDGQLRALFVRSDAQGRGIGGALLDAVLAGRAEGLALYVAKSNPGARRFYERKGFAVTGEAVRQYRGIDIVYLGMEIAADKYGPA